MKTIWINLILLIAIFISCEKNDNSDTDSIIYKSSFSTEKLPLAVDLDKINGFVFIANHNPTITDYSSKIQKFDIKGILQETVVDFESFESGVFDKYLPIDLCAKNNNIYVLVKPMLMSNDEWETQNGFCILNFSYNGNLINEFDFSQQNNYWNYSTITFFNDFLYVTNGQLIINKIDCFTGEATDIHIPIANDKSYMLVSDMIVDTEENIYFTGQAPWGLDSVEDASICHITRLDCINEKNSTFYSATRTGVLAAMPNSPGLAMKSNGNIYLSTFYGRSIEIYNKENELILQKEIKPNDLEETLPIDIALYNDDIYVVDNKNDMVHIYHGE
jgi:hypothetical protein